MIRDAAWPGSDQRPWGTPSRCWPARSPWSPSAPDRGGLVCCFPSLGCPTCVRVCNVHGHLALVFLMHGGCPPANITHK